MTLLSDALDFLYGHFQRPELLALIIPAILLAIWILSRTFIVIKEDDNAKRQRLLVQRFMKVSRALIITLLIIAIASPYVIRDKTIEGEPSISILQDNSTSMSLYDPALGQTLHDALTSRLTTELKTIASGDTSAIGDGILRHLKRDQSIILITDGNNNRGSNLGDVALYATKLNATIHAIDLEAKRQDHAVTITGPSKTVEDVENQYTVTVTSAQPGAPIALKVTLDGSTVYEAVTGDKTYTFTRKLTEGTHLLTAEVGDADHVAQNNKWHKAIKVVPKPRFLVLSDDTSPITPLIRELYDVETVATLPQDLTPYYAVLLNDQEADKIPRPKVEQLSNYVTDGNGLVVIGGKGSFEKGGYKNAPIETILPVFVSTPGKKEGDVNIVLLIDISGSTGSALIGGQLVLDVNKALALGIITDLGFDNRVAALAFNTQPYIVQSLQYLFESPDLVDKIKRLQFSGGTIIESGILGAMELLKQAPGAKNIILISDGLTQSPANTENAAKLAANDGIRIYTVGVGPQTNAALMQRIADVSNGIYFPADDTNRIKILFGKPNEDKILEYPVAILDSNHFITQNVKTKANVFGFNEVVPKSSAKSLVTTGTGEPLITIWRLGLGRVAAVTTDDGSVWAGQLTQRANSQLLTRTMNWAIGDPDRKAAGLITIKDGRIGEPLEITVKSDTPPSADGIAFYKTEEEMYVGVVTPVELGFQEALGVKFAVNYPIEYDSPGLNPELARIVASTGGKLWQADDIDGIANAVRAHATRTITGRDDIRWPFAIGAIIIFLIEVVVRRILRRE